MKVRHGFVSNSSSSSFIVEGNATTAQVAITMMYEIKSDWEGMRSYYGEDWKEPESFVQAFDWLSKNQEYNEPILIPWSTNYETFIWRGDKICVSTCNNHDWSLVGGSYEEYEDRFYEECELKSFLDLSDMQHKTKQDFRDEQMARWKREEDENS